MAENTKAGAIGCGVFLVLGIVVTTALEFGWFSKRPQPAPLDLSKAIAVDELVGPFKEEVRLNRFRAQKNYNNREVLVKGAIKHINLGSFLLAGEKQFLQCNVKGSMLEYSVSQTVTVKGVTDVSFLTTLFIDHPPMVLTKGEVVAK